MIFVFWNVRLNILNVLGASSMKIDMFCRETLFQHIPAYFLNLKVYSYQENTKTKVKALEKSLGVANKIAPNVTLGLFWFFFLLNFI